ncbi:fasciclin-like arabinogalactan protein elcF [Argentina anserina]|uniref:fasciclin-like arabinogalactan protein elcF n=1 Tax=Argentina anserina TaxID=57926 RepID=UPI0021766236|nr:fasciclin-like arabinogalactan protein elcF [Potentilla anserina]
MSRTRVSRNPIAFVSVVVLVCCFVILALTMLRLPDPNMRATTHHSHKLKIGKFGEMMMEMLPDYLAFTVFLPSEKAFKRDLRLDPSDSFVGEKMNDTYAVVSRVLGFSAVPRSISSDSVAFGKEMSYDSISGFVLHVSKDEDGRLVVNGVRSERVDLGRKGSVVHVMDGVLMDAEFRQSVQYDGEED